VLMNFQQEIGDILVSIGHSFEPFDFVVDPLRDGRGDPLLEVVQDNMPFAEELFGQFLERGDAGPERSCYPLPESGPGMLAGSGAAIDFEKLFFE